MNKFSKDYTNAIKGVAIIMMLIHHLFYDEIHMNKFTLLLNSSKYFVFIASMCKVCVSIFLLLSGYGLYKSYNKNSNKKTLKESGEFSFTYVKKLLFKYWWAIIPFMIYGIVFKARTLSVAYEGNVILSMLTDLLGINYLIYGTSNLYNVTCWYISLAILLYFLYPFFDYLIKKSTLLFIGVALFVSFVEIATFIHLEESYFLAFALGILLSHYQILDILIEKICSRYIYNIASIILLIVTAYIRYKYDIIADGLFAFSIILIIIEVINYIPRIKPILIFIGKHSANVFMTHTFFYKYMFTSIVYYPKYPILVLAWLLIICLIYSIILEKIKSILNILFKKFN